MVFRRVRIVGDHLYGGGWMKSEYGWVKRLVEAEMLEEYLLADETLLEERAHDQAAGKVTVAADGEEGLDSIGGGDALRFPPYLFDDPLAFAVLVSDIKTPFRSAPETFTVTFVIDNTFKAGNFCKEFAFTHEMAAKESPCLGEIFLSPIYPLNVNFGKFLDISDFLSYKNFCGFCQDEGGRYKDS